METRNDILDELRSWQSPLADMPRTIPFAVPEGYFEGLDKQVMANISADIGSPIPVPKNMPYDVPQGYFENLPAQMLALAGEEPQLSLPKTMPFEVPQGYFESLPQHILEEARKTGKTTKVIPIPLGKKIGRSIRWAAAAVLLLTISIGSYRMLNPAITLNPEQKLAQLPENEISEYIVQNIDEFDMDLLENNIASANSIQSLSDEDIIDYLDETGWNTTVTN
jgi:hypothetical protein